MFRDATEADLLSLMRLERDASVAALGHVFPPDRYPFPEYDVLARWRLALDDPTVRVKVVDAPAGMRLAALVAHDGSTLRHLAVHPTHWGSGLATTAIAMVLDEMAQQGATVAGLWCLEQNHRARRLYEHLGWRLSDRREEAAWPPYPTQIWYTHPVPDGHPRPDRAPGDTSPCS